MCPVRLSNYWKKHRTLARFVAVGFMLAFPFVWLFCILKAIVKSDGVRDELKDGPGVFMCGFFVAFSNRS